MKKTKLLLTGIVSAAMVVSAAGCSSQSSRPPKPNDGYCDDWEWDADDGVWECDDRNSSYYGSSYHGGSYYKSKSDLYKSSSYQNYRSSSSFQGGSSGFGSGSKGGFGG